MNGPRRWARGRLLGLSVVLGAAACGGASHTGQATLPDASVDPAASAPIDRLLDHFHIESILAPRARAFTRQVALIAGDLSDAELERLVPAVRTGFDASRMRNDVSRFVLSEAPDGYVDEVAEWVTAGASADVDRQASAYDPPVSLGEWLDTYTTEPPSETRIQLISRWSSARQEGTFFLLLEQALDEAAHEVWSALRSSAPEFEALTGEALFNRLRQSSAAAVVTALHAHEPITDDLMRASATEYESEPGRWFVETYQVAVAEAVRAAGQRTAAELRRRGIEPEVRHLRTDPDAELGGRDPARTQPPSILAEIAARSTRAP